MRWDDQRVAVDDGALPGLARLGLVSLEQIERQLISGDGSRA
jgi:hypothetical protein